MKKLYSFICILFIVFSINSFLSNHKVITIKFNSEPSITEYVKKSEKVFCFNREHYDKNIYFIDRDRDTLPSTLISAITIFINNFSLYNFDVKNITPNKNIHCISKVVLRL